MLLGRATVLLLGCWAGDAASSSTAVQHFPTGQLIESVQSASSPQQRFTLYLPTGFDPARPAPIIYLMDPRGRARVPAKLFQTAAERYGYILISSHSTSSDGPMHPNLHAMQAMWDDSHAWFSIDPRRVYLAGFSGTARTASMLAQNRSEGITGLIGSGAGFHPDVEPSPKLPFLYFGGIGDVDYNFHELETLEDQLVAHDLPHRVERFPGPHSWMPPEVALRAVEWMDLRAMQAGSRPRDAALIDAWWTRDETAARERLDQGRVLDASRQYAAMARDFAGLRDTAQVKLAAARIAASPSAQSQLTARKGATRHSDEWVNRGMQLIADVFPEGQSEPALVVEDVAQALGLNKMQRAAAGPDRDAALEAQRRLNQLEVQLGFYLPHEALSMSEFSRAGYYLSLAMQIDDASPVSWYLQAQRHARMKATHQALTALKRAVAVGFRDVSLLEADASFRGLRSHPDYVATVERLRSEGDALDTRTVDRPPAHVVLQ